MKIRFFFGFSSMEANGFVILSFIMIISISLPLWVHYVFYQPEKNAILSSESQKLDSLILVLESGIIKENSQYSFINFDPNEVSPEELHSMGVPLFLAKRIERYREKVKPFKDAEELRSIYGLDSSLFHLMKPFVHVKERQSSSNKNQEIYTNKYYNKPIKNEAKAYQKVNHTLIAFDINTADTSQLKSIYGIGTAFAKRITAFRSALGGFYSINQLKEVYGLKSPALDSLLKYSYVQKDAALKKLAINELNLQELAAHPYLSKKEAKLIVAYRNQHGPFIQQQELINIPLIDTTKLLKLVPYLHFE